MLAKPLVLYVIRHRTYGSLHGCGDMGEWSGVFTCAAAADRERRDGLSTPEEFEIVELKEVDEVWDYDPVGVFVGVSG